MHTYIGWNLYYFGRRYYDGALGRWNSVDPMASKYPGRSPYNYCLNNPLKLVDRLGKEPIVSTSEDQKKLDDIVFRLNTTPTGQKIVAKVYSIKEKIYVSFNKHEMRSTNRLTANGETQSSFSVPQDGKVTGRVTMVVFNEEGKSYDPVRTGAHEFTHVVRTYENSQDFYENSQRDQALTHDEQEEEKIAIENGQKVKKEYNGPALKPLEEIKRK